jgi:subtilisin-like proprotein convertase family protein
MRGTFASTFWMPIPLGTAGVSSSVVVYGLASVPLDLVVTVNMSHPNPGALVLTLTDPNGDTATVWAPGDGVAGTSTVTVDGISGDDQVNGTWSLTVADPTASGAGVLQGWSLYVTSNWD